MCNQRIVGHRNFLVRLTLFAALSLIVMAMIGDTPLMAAGATITHGPVVGGVTESAAQVFLRASQDASVSVRYGTDPNLASYQTSSAVAVSSASDDTAILPLSALAPETTYYLNPLANGVPSLAAPPYPSFKTFPPVGSARDFKFIVLTDFTTIANLTKSSPSFASAGAESADFVFLGGDFDHRNPSKIADKREMFKGLYSPTTHYMDGFVSQILNRLPIVHQWDDHDAGGNNVDKTYPNWAVSQQAFNEYVPSYPLPALPFGVWQMFSYAQAECFVLDCRSQRDPEHDPDDAQKSMLDGNGLGAAGELSWLETGLSNSPARWKIIFTSVVTNPSTKFPDGWAGYQTEWTALKSYITSHNIRGVVFISGDLHLGGIDNGAASGFPEMCVAAVNTEQMDHCSTSPPGTWSEGYFTDPCDGYGVVQVLQNPDRMILEAVDETGAVRNSYTVNARSPTPTPEPSPSPPVITKQPHNTTVPAGASARFTVAASSTVPLDYQWQKNGQNLTDARSPAYVTPPTTTGDNGEVFNVIVSNISGNVTSKNATLTVTTTSQAASPGPP